METKLMTYTKPSVRVQLIKIEKEDIGTDGITTSLTKIYYQIRDNRKRVYNTEDEHLAVKTFYNYIARHILQTKLL